jgi:hypothetical protein
MGRVEPPTLDQAIGRARFSAVVGPVAINFAMLYGSFRVFRHGSAGGIAVWLGCWGCVILCSVVVIREYRRLLKIREARNLTE